MHCKIQSNYIRYICPDITKKEIKKLMKMFNGSYVNKKTSLIITNKIEQSNKQNNILDSAILKTWLDGFVLSSSSNSMRTIIKTRNFLKNEIRFL